MDDEEPSFVSQLLEQFLPPGEQAQLDDETNTSFMKIPVLFCIAVQLSEAYKQIPVGELLDKAINYAEQLKRLLATLDPQPTHEPTAETAAAFLVMVLEQKTDDQSDQTHFEQLIAACEDHLKIATPETSVTTKGTLAHAYMQLYYRTKDQEALKNAIAMTREHLIIIESIHNSSIAAQSDSAEHLASNDDTTVPDHIRYGTRRNLVNCLAEQHWSGRDADSLYDLINECAYSLKVLPETAKEHGMVQEIMNFAVMAWYFRRLGPEWDMQALFEGNRLVADTPMSSRADDEDVLQQDMLSLEISGNIYEKHVLERGTKNIRLLELLPGSEGSQVVCKLSVVDWDDKPTYNALSYVWGVTKDTREIRVNNSAMDVTVNLFRALSRLRKHDQSLLLWVDAICINQNDDIEKSHQIDLMRDVYSSADQVIMWLGEPESSSTAPLPKKIQTSHEMVKSMKELWPPWVYKAFKAFIDEDNLTGPEEEPFGSQIGDDLRFRELIDQLPDEVRPIFYTPPVTDLGVIDNDDKESVGLVITTLLSQSFNALNDMADLSQQNVFSYQQDGKKIEVFDWRKSAEIPKFFLGPLQEKEWPVLGAFSIMYFLATSKHLTTIPFFAKDENITRCLSQAWLKSVCALQDLLENVYWMRAWITQEIVLAKDPVIYYGRHIMSFKTLATAQVVLKQHKNSVCCASALQERLLTPCHGTPIWSALETQFSRIEDLTDMWLQNAHARGQGKQIDIPWTNILSFNITRRYATNPLDHVYGILGLVDNSGPDRVVADYSASPAKVYAQATSLVIKTSGNLKVFASHTAAVQKQFQLPSWVPDWSTGGTDIGIAYPWKPQNTAAGVAASSPIAFHEDFCLQLLTTHIDTVASISPHIEDCTNCSLTTRATIISSWRSLAGLSDTITNPSHPRETSFWRTIFSNHLFSTYSIRDRPQMTEQDVERVQRWWAWMQTVRQPPQKVVFGGKELFTQPDVRGRDDEVDQMVHVFMRRKVFYVTRGGRLGTARARVEWGDEVHVVQGCGFGVVLRRAGGKVDGMEEEQNSFFDLEGCTHDHGSVLHYISDAYIHGVMDAGAECAGQEQRSSETVFIR